MRGRRMEEGRLGVIREARFRCRRSNVQRSSDAYVTKCANAKTNKTHITPPPSSPPNSRSLYSHYYYYDGPVVNESRENRRVKNGNDTRPLHRRMQQSHTHTRHPGRWDTRSRFYYYYFYYYHPGKDISLSRPVVVCVRSICVQLRTELIKND